MQERVDFVTFYGPHKGMNEATPEGMGSLFKSEFSFSLSLLSLDSYASLIVR